MKNNTKITERSIAYSLRIINLFRQLEKDSVGRIIGKQLLRSGTSIGANAHEAQGAQSRADFIVKMSIAHKEAWESIYWLRLIIDAKLLPDHLLHKLIDETEQIKKILASILLTAKENK